MKKTYLAGLVVFVIIVLGAVTVPKTMAQKQGNEKIPGQYIVVFKEGVNADVATDEIVKNQGLGHLFTYKHALHGFAATIPQAKLDKVKNDSRVEYVTEDRVVTADGKPSGQTVKQPGEIVPTGVSRIGANSSTSKGNGVTVAVLDTGIDLTHPDLKENIIPGSGKTCIQRTTTNDDNGHGTHVAGTIAARDNEIGVVGVAPLAKLIPVKVLDRNGSGSWSSVICGIEWVTTQNTDKDTANDIKVVNMSLGGGGSSDDNCGIDNQDPLHTAICKSRDAGVTYVVAAGNDGKNASTSVPAAYDDAVITVSALVDTDGKAGGSGITTGYGDDDTFASFSNYGTVVDIAAPGVNILSTWKGGGYNTISGTSMATPHVSGVAALYIASHSGSSWTDVKNGLIFAGETLNFGHTDTSGNHPERVLQVTKF